MKAKELVKACEKICTCQKCPYGEVCEAYQIQFKCYPFEARKRRKYAPDIDSDVQIQFSDFII